jgi:hypothetical protein
MLMWDLIAALVLVFATLGATVLILVLGVVSLEAIEHIRRRDR